MARIPETDLERVKRETDLIALIQSRGVVLKQQGANWTGFCPFHSDTKTPNLIVTPGKGLFRCMAACCGKSGNAIQFVQWHDGLSFRHAFELLDGGGKAAFQSAPKDGPTKVSTVPKLPCPLDEGGEDAELMAQVVDYYHERLWQCPDAMDYLRSRGLDDEEQWKRFKIGAADRTLGLRMPDKKRRQGKQLREHLQKLGVYRRSGHEHLNGCITIPIHSAKGDIVQLYGRRFDPNAPKPKRHLYLARPLAGIFNPDALTAPPNAEGQREIILTESLIDALTFHRHGLENVTCSYGTANFTDELLQAIVAAKIDSVRLAFDADPAGEKALLEVSEKLQAHGLQCHQIRFPQSLDANQYAQEQGPEALKQAVRNALWMEPQKSELSQSRAPTSSLVANLAAKKEEVAIGAKPPKPTPTKSAEHPAPVPSCLRERIPAETQLQAQGEHFTFEPSESRSYRIGGLLKNSSLDTLKITLRIASEGLLHVDSLDLYKDADRRRYIDRAAEETLLEKDLIKRDLGKLLLQLEEHQEQRLNAPKDATEAAVDLSPEDHAAALDFLQKPGLLERIASAYQEAGIVGEETNLLTAFLAATSRKLKRPLAVIIQSTSAAGKSTLMEAVLSFFPPEEQVKYSAMTGQSLYYLGESNLKHKILAIVEEEGAEKASYALKLLQSEGELTIASTGKDPQSGRMETQEYHVEGPVAIVLTTTSIDIDEELLNRCLVLTVDESTEQTEKIHALQRQARTPEGILVAERRKEIRTLIQNAQRLIEPRQITNPYADRLTFTTASTRTRRDHEKYLTLIDTIALLHQHQRESISRELPGGRVLELLPVTLEDIAAANRLAPEVLGRSLDELPPQSRRLLEHTKRLIREKMQAENLEQRLTLFSRRELREFTGWSETQTRLHLDRLEAMEYIHRRSGRQGTICKYEVLIDVTEEASAYHIGLIDLETLKEKPAKPQKSA